MGTLMQFRLLIRGWYVSADGEDFCPDCWPKKVDVFKDTPEIQRDFIKDSKPLVKLAHTRYGRDGWFCQCEKCKRSEFGKYSQRELLSLNGSKERFQKNLIQLPRHFQQKHTRPHF